MKPIIRWKGGKSDEMNHILPHVPESYDRYIEPFVGGGALFFHLEPEKGVINDVHTELVDFYRAVKEGRSRDIYAFMESHPNDESTYYKVRSTTPTTPFENACRFYYLRKTCYRGMLRYNKQGGFNVSYGAYKKVNYDALLDESYTELMSRTDVLNDGFELLFDRYNDESNFMFLDPPYDSVFTDYGYCTFGKDEHRRLAELFKTTDIRCLMVIGKTPFISDLYAGYIAEEYDKKYRHRFHSGRTESTDNAVHLVVKNYK